MAQSSTWTFLTNHARVLVYVASNPSVRMRDIAEGVGITERAAHRIVSELVEDAYLTRHKLGRRSYYEVHPDKPLRGTTENGHAVGEVLGILIEPARAA